MNNNDFEARLRALEYYHNLKLLPGAWTVLRVDGRGFSTFTATRFAKPFDERMSAFMTETARALLEEFGGVYAYTESDEISVLFPPSWTLFDRELEKLVSLSAGFASATFSLACGARATFDSRVWLGVKEQDVVDYFRWRQADAARCALNGLAYWTLRQEGKSVAEATRILEGQTVAFKNELLFERGVNFNEVPAWQRRGVGVYWETYEKDGFNPVTNEVVKATRRRVKIDTDLPMKDAYDAFLRRLLDDVM
ncbi:tRNA(His) guanylyltransferase Thg1 family protein [Deinococcus yavapaiensis]|uniref:tRNA(His) guanylyltransferase n=1 Tax=Deinococcus yavapaiensis KR-236 TaxID=694435 RepID=A0A318S5P5_9DEIO|nr:tRNA(His) guanylyltransferase Thg1 family protein [Deinococcus yavapaiensis]PYE49492.1 tRNA(His)-5'-guanylyltransferase [Deinococcus yavapaiensis KR-236]